MFSLNKIKKNFLVSFGCALIGIAPVWADDTEIFFGDTTGSGVAPNIMFIVDTSGSMRNWVSGTGKTRMQNVQDALRTLLNNLNNVNVGMMRFSNPGGPVLYQVDYIDRNVNANTSTEVVTTLADNDDDAQQVDGTGQMVVDGKRLDMIMMTVGSADTLVREIQSGSDDVEEQVGASGDNVLRINGDLELTHDDGNASKLQTIGLRFAGTNVPDGATVTNAYITLKVDNAGAGGTAETVITGEYGPSAVFADINDNVTDRTRTTASVDWDVTNPASQAFVVTPDLTPVVQNIIDHPDWKGDGTQINDMTFIIEQRAGSTSVAEHDLQAYDRGDFPPTLTVEYYVGSPPTLEKGLTGLRFQDVNVPKGVTISSAYIDFVVGQTDAGETTNLTIYGESNDAPAAYSSGNKISTRTKTGASVAWSNVESWNANNEVKSTPDLTSVVQEIVSLNDWCGGDDMAFIIEGTEGLRSAHARDADNGLQPVLRIQYDNSTVVPGSSCAQAQLSKQITDTNDDVEEDGSSVYITSDDYDFQSSSRRVGLRFTGLNLPRGTTINNAYIEFVSKTNYSSSSTTIQVEVENTGDAEPFTNTNGVLDDRTWGASHDWVITSSWNDVGKYQTDDIKTLVQAAVDHADWAIGNDMAFRLRKTGGSTRRADTYDRDPVRAARLVVDFLDDGTEAAKVRLVRDELLEVVDGLNTSGYTPIQDTLYEAALYYTGGDVDYGKKRGGPNDYGPHAYTRLSKAESMVAGSYTINYPSGCTADDLGASACDDQTLSASGGTDPLYKSPINDWCQKENHIILLTDGQANRPHSDTKIDNFIGAASCDNTGLSSGEYCVKDLVKYLYENDQSDLKNDQIIRTHTIGFNFSSQWLKDVAAAGGGQYKEATQASDLVTEVENILTEVLKTNSSFVAPVAAINQFNRLNHRQEIYFAVFRPDETPSWPGNLKKYKLRSDDNAVIDFSDTPIEAIDPTTGFFSDQAESAWGNEVDGKEVDISGANAQMPAYNLRNLYTYYSGSASKTLSNSVNLLTTSNTNLTKAMFDATGMSDTEFATHIDWVRGKDVDDEDGDSVTAENRYILGDPLHSKPIAVTYGGTEADPDITIFFGSNSGALHAVSSKTGVEQFAFFPEETLDNQEVLRTNSTTENHVYGIDGNVTPWINDADGNGIISGADEFVRIFVGMRRGGRNYYALDVTDRDNPKIMWEIKGGSGDFAELGQTWSQPVLGNILIGTTETDVLYFGGGYDADQDNTAMRAADDMGRAVYIVNAETGALIWKGGDGAGFTADFDDMQYSIPADLSVADVESNGNDDMFFVGDMGGQVWRFDINNGAAVADLISGGVIADVGVAGGTNTAADNRRFYHGPDLALVYKQTQSNPDEKETVLAVTIGSGYQAHPLAKDTDDRFYMFLQGDPYTVPASYEKLVTDDLYDATDNDVGENVSGAVALLNAASGWYFNLPRVGEKVLSTPLTFKNTVTFTTYEPNPTASSSRCSPVAGVSRVYQVNLIDASPVNDWDDVDGLTEADRGITLSSSSIIDEPVIVCTGAGCDMFVGAEKPPVDTPTTDRIVKTFWRKN